MGRLLNPGLGELMDRFTILQLKIMHAPIGTTTHFHTEQAQIQMLMERVWSPIDKETDGLFDRLLETNKHLWGLEDEMAKYAKRENFTYGDRSNAVIAQVAIEIWRFNRERNLVIDEINKRVGHFQGAEKL